MLYKYLLKNKWHIISFVLITVFSAVMMSLFALHIADVFTAAELCDHYKVLELIIKMFAWYIFIKLIDYYAELYGIYIVNKIRRNIKNDMFDSIISKEIYDFTSKNSGEYISEFTNDITIIETKYLIPLKELITYFITIVTVSSVIFTIDIRMTLILLGGAALCLLLPVILSKYTSSKMMFFLKQFDAFIQYLKDTFNAFFVFKNYAIENKVIEQFGKENSHVEDKKYEAEFSLVVVNNLVGRVAWLVPLIVVVLGLQGVINGSLAIGSVFSAYLLSSELGMPLQSIGHRIGMIRSVKWIDKKIYELNKAKKPITENDMPVNSFEKLDIKYRNVSLDIKGRTILDGLDLSFDEGKKYLIIGKNGSGKSTSLKLLKNTYSSYKGEITLNGHELRTLDGKRLSESISYSNETVSLLSDSVRNNILLFREIPEDQLATAVQKAGLYVPLDREVGDEGRFLSSGERRKLEIARAIVGKPNVVIFDEVISTLDIETAFEIEQLILRLETTVIMISNAFSGQLLPRYDEIILMDRGRVLAHGTHSELLGSSPDYREIYRIRCGNEVKGDDIDAD